MVKFIGILMSFVTTKKIYQDFKKNYHLSVEKNDLILKLESFFGNIKIIHKFSDKQNLANKICCDNVEILKMPKFFWQLY